MDKPISYNIAGDATSFSTLGELIEYHGLEDGDIYNVETWSQTETTTIAVYTNDDGNIDYYITEIDHVANTGG